MASILWLLVLSLCLAEFATEDDLEATSYKYYEEDKPEGWSPYELENVS